MAKEKAKAKDKPVEKTAKEPAPSMKYGVNDLAELLGIQPASARVRLRDCSVPKAGKAYGWNTKAELEEVAAKVKPKDTEASKSAPAAKGGKTKKAA